MRSDDIKRVLLIEFHDGRPFSAITETAEGYHDQWDFDYCKAHGVVYYHNSGGGPARGLSVCGSMPDAEPLKFWAVPDMDVAIDGNAVRIADCPGSYTPENLFDVCQPDETVYCTVCDDHYPTDSECRHLWWIDELGWWGGCGAGDTEAKYHRESLIKLLAVLECVEEIRDALKIHECRFRTYGPCIGGPQELQVKIPGHHCWKTCATFGYPEPMELQAGAFWLLSLEDGKTAEYDDITVGWIDEYLANDSGSKEEPTTAAVVNAPEVQHG